MFKYIESEKVYISLLSGYNTYVETEDYTETLTGQRAMVIQHTRTKELYYAIPISTPLDLMENEWFVQKWRKLIDYPCNSVWLWPVDFIRKDIGADNSFLVYAFCSKFQYESIATLSFEKDFLGVDNSYARMAALALICAYESIYEKKYLFFGLDDDKIFVNKKESSLLIPIHEDISIDRNSEIVFTEDDYFSEVIDPYHYANRRKNAQDKDVYLYDAASENYAFVSILFRLLIGLYPYEGPMLDEYEYNLNSSENTDWIYKYVQNPVFIFDMIDKSNSIEMYNKNQIHVKRWSLLSDKLREMFTNTLTQRNVMRISSVFYTPTQWRVAIEETIKNIS